MAEPVNPQGSSESLEVQISKVLANVDEGGKVKFEEGVDPLFKAAVLAEKKYRDTQASFTKNQQELARLKAKAEVLEKQVTSTVQLTAEQVQELEDLKYSNPDEWFHKKQAYETTAKQSTSTKLQELTEQAAQKALLDLTKGEKDAILLAFNSQTGLGLTEDVLANDIPLRLQMKSETMPYEDYLKEVANYLGKTKVIKNTDPGLDVTDIHSMAGRDTTSAGAVKRTIL